MFFVVTSGQKEKKLQFNQMIMCKNCDRYGHIEIYKIYSYLSFFFIPLFKWNKRYYAKMQCCNAVCEISKELGIQIEKGVITSLDPSILHFTKQYQYKTCYQCGYTTSEDFDYCPKCGSKL